MFAVVIPTRNRPDLLQNVLRELIGQSRKPDFIVIVDSSDQRKEVEVKLEGIPIFHILTEIRSAAHQRNLGIDFVLKFSEIKFLSFLDDDISIPTNYLQAVEKLFVDYPDAIGVSGIAAETEKPRNNSWVTTFLGLNGRPGELTKAVINVAPPTQGQPMEVEWLIGCSTWKVEKLNEIRFEDDFIGQSIFEDVIFSSRMSNYGKLICSPNLRFNHWMSEVERPDLQQSYLYWTVNRYRVFRYPIPKVSKLYYWFSIPILFLAYCFLGLNKLENDSRKKAKGILQGGLHLLKNRFSGRVK